MKSTSILYNNKHDLESYINSGALNPQTPYFIRIYVAMATVEEALGMAVDIQDLFPNAKIIGCSASGIIYKGEQYADKNLVVFEAFQTTQTLVQSFSWKDKNAAAVATEVAAYFADKNVKLAHVLCSDLYYDVNDFVSAFNCLNNTTMLTGGIAGDVLPLQTPAFVFTPEGTISEGMLVGALCGEDLRHYTAVNIAHEPISPKYTLTKTEGSIWKTVDDKEADEWFRECLGIDTLVEYSDWQVIADNDVMVRFPIVLEGHNGASRFLKYDYATKSIMQYFSRLPEGTEFRIGYVNPTECVKESFRICNEIMEQPTESLFTYSCLFRRLYLNNCASWELSPYDEMSICGAFFMGEICYLNGVNEFLNGSCTITGLAESDVYVLPDISKFEQLQKIEDDTKDLLNVVLKKQSESMSRFNEQLMNKLLRQQEHAKKQLYIDYNTGIANYMKFKEDRKSTAFNKICMVKIENAELMITHLGHEAYMQIIKEGVSHVADFMQSIKERGLISNYLFNDTTFFMVADDRMTSAHFIELSTYLFDTFRFIKIGETDDVLVTRFVVVVNQEDIVEIALNTFQANKNIQVPFLICEDDTSKEHSTSDEFKMIGVLNRALEKDGIIPYFQGIRDNVTCEIAKFEALMRIQDVDGTIYAPGQFMSIAKKYHLYSHLSKKMIEKVFSLFANTKYTVSINVSVYDINSTQMLETIYGELEKIGDASNFIVEILEDEELRDIGRLKDFIENVRKYGVKIAIDDFGAGYSNLLEIASMAPDFIKVDGGIIRNIHEGLMNSTILDIIIYIGQRFNTEIIAEFVENEVIQAHMEKRNIRFSQGYYFAKPMPYEALSL